MKGTTRNKAINSARNKSKSNGRVKNEIRVYAFESEFTNQYYNRGEWYIQDVNPEKSFSIGGKKEVVCYLDGIVR